MLKLKTVYNKRHNYRHKEGSDQRTVQHRVCISRSCRTGQGYKEEVKRHNQALVKLAKAKERCYESEVKRRNDEARRRAAVSEKTYSDGVRKANF
jgi:hypothetical protein